MNHWQQSFAFCPSFISEGRGMDSVFSVSNDPIPLGFPYIYHSLNLHGLPVSCQGLRMYARCLGIQKLLGIHYCPHSKWGNRKTYLCHYLLWGLRKKGLYEAPQHREKKVLGSILRGRISEGFIRGLWSRVCHHNEVPRGLVVCEYQKNIFESLKLCIEVVHKKQLYKTQWF